MSKLILLNLNHTLTMNRKRSEVKLLKILFKVRRFFHLFTKLAQLTTAEAGKKLLSNFV